MNKFCILGHPLGYGRLLMAGLALLVLVPACSEAANLPTAASKTTPAPASGSGLNAAAPSAPTALPAANSSPAPVVESESKPPVQTPSVQLPYSFTDFAADFHPQQLQPRWLAVQMGVVETVFAPPQEKTMFVLPDLQSSLADIYQPVELSCLLGAKSRYENATNIEVDPLGHPLGYSAPLGKIIYALARDEQTEGISFTFYYYEASQLRWISNPVKTGWYMPTTQATVVAQSFVVPADKYVFMYLSSRMGEPRPGSTARPVPMYTYLILHVHPVAPPAPAIDSAAPATSTP